MYEITLFCREGCRPCDLVTPAFVKAQASGRYKVGLRYRKLLVDDDDDDFPVQQFPTLALTDGGAVARTADKQPVVPPLVGGSAIRKGLDAFLAAHANPIPLAFDSEF